MVRAVLPLAALALAVLTVQVIAAPAATLQVCVRRDSKDPTDFNTAFGYGPVSLPAGTVFDLAGHTFGGALDPLDGMHDKPGGGWTGISAAEEERRGQMMAEDQSMDQAHKSGVVTLAQAQLTKAKPCTAIAVAALLSSDWNWTVSPIFGDQSLYFQAYGIIHGGTLNTDWSKEDRPLRWAGQVGALDGVLQGTTSRVITLRSDGSR